MGGNNAFVEATKFAGDLVTGGAVSANEAKRDAETAAERAKKDAKKRLKEERENAALAKARAIDKSLNKRRSGAQTGTGRTDTFKTGEAGVTGSTPGTKKTLGGA